jgi:hypothetical protein
MVSTIVIAAWVFVIVDMHPRMQGYVKTGLGKGKEKDEAHEINNEITIYRSNDSF